MQGNSEPFLCFWQKLLCHSQAIVSGSPSICIGPSLFQGQNFPVSESVDRSEFETGSWDVPEPTLSLPAIETGTESHQLTLSLWSQ